MKERIDFPPLSLITIDEKLMKDKEFYDSLSVVDLLDWETNLIRTSCDICRALLFYQEKHKTAGKAITEKYAFYLNGCPVGKQLLMIGKSYSDRGRKRYYSKNEDEQEPKNKSVRKKKSEDMQEASKKRGRKRKTEDVKEPPKKRGRKKKVEDVKEP